MFVHIFGDSCVPGHEPPAAENGYIDAVKDNEEEGL
jgi:hypothetical protein